jgi:xylulokinase
MKGRKAIAKSTDKCFIGYDLGTSGVKTVLIDSKGTLIASAFAPYPSSSPKPGYHEQRPEDWWDAIVKTTRRVVRDSRIPRTKISGISFGVQVFGTIPVTKEGHALRPCMTWLDSRSTNEANRINESMGISISAKDFPAKALWIRENESDIFAKAHKIVDCDGYLIAKYTGNFVCPGEIAYGMGFDPVKKQWQFESFGITSDKLPEPVTTTTVVGEVTAAAAKQTGLRPAIPVIAGGSDFASAVVGSGAIKPGRAHVYMGSSAWIAVATNTLPSAETEVGETKGEGLVRQYESAIFSGNFLDRWIIGGESESACACLNWFKNELASDLDEKAKHTKTTPHQMLDKMAEQVQPGAGNLIFIPWMKGERAPVKDDFARGAFIGLALTHRRENLVRAIMEGVALNMAWVLEQIQVGHNLGFEVQSLRAIGGGFKSRIWTQIFADVMGRRIERVKWPDYAGAIGAALFSSLGTGVYKGLDELDGLLPSTFEATPRNQYRDMYDRLLANYKRTYTREIEKIYHEWGPV